MRLFPVTYRTYNKTHRNYVKYGPVFALILFKNYKTQTLATDIQ